MDSATRDGSAPAGITPEIMVAIDAAVTAYLGRKANIISVRLGLAPQDHPSLWADEGRNLLNESHNLIQRGH